jgi:hypothetical protein
MQIHLNLYAHLFIYAFFPSASVMHGLVLIQIIRTLIIGKNNLRKKKATTQIGTNVRARGFNAELLAKSQFASGRSCDLQTRSRLLVASLGSRTNADLVPKFHVALYASHAALPMETLNCSLTLTWLWVWAGPPCSWGIWVRAPYMNKKESNCQTKKFKIWSSYQKGARHQDKLADCQSVANSTELNLETTEV